MEMIDRSHSMHDVGDDPFGGMSRPATVIDARRSRTAVRYPRPPLARAGHRFDYGIAIAAIVAVPRSRASPVPSPCKEIV